MNLLVLSDIRGAHTQVLVVYCVAGGVVVQHSYAVVRQVLGRILGRHHFRSTAAGARAVEAADVVHVSVGGAELDVLRVDGDFLLYGGALQLIR